MQRTTNEKKQFLTQEEVKILNHSSSIAGIAGQRAKALLLVNEGMTQLGAANESGLTRGQVKYVVAKYGRVGISAFQQTPPSTEVTKEVKSTPAKPEVKAEKAEKAEKAQDKKDKKKKKKKKKSKIKSQPQPEKMKKADKKKKGDKKKKSSKKKDSKKKDSKKKGGKKKDKKKKK